MFTGHDAQHKTKKCYNKSYLLAHRNEYEEFLVTVWLSLPLCLFHFGIWNCSNQIGVLIFVRENWTNFEAGMKPMSYNDQWICRISFIRFPIYCPMFAWKYSLKVLCLKTLCQIVMIIVLYCISSERTIPISIKPSRNWISIRVCALCNLIKKTIYHKLTETLTQTCTCGINNIWLVYFKGRECGRVICLKERKKTFSLNHKKFL